MNFIDSVSIPNNACKNIPNNNKNIVVITRGIPVTYVKKNAFKHI